MKKKTTKSKKSAPKKEFISFVPLNKAAEAAVYFGFTPIKNISISKDDVHKANALKESWAKNCAGMPWLFSQTFVEERIAIIRDYIEGKLISQPQPLMFIHETELIKERGKSTINLEVIGSERAIAEALLIKTTTSILKDNGYKDISIEINSIGDRESISKYSRELTNFYKKNLNQLGAHCRQNFKKEPFYVLPCCECDPEGKIKEIAPTSISSLSDTSRMHFKEVLEYIETMEIPYTINNCLVPDRKYGSGIVFEIRELLGEGKTGEILAVGFRYDGLAQKVGNKRDIPGAGVKIFLKKKAVVKKVSKLPKPIAFYIQLGEEAKHKSLEVIERLRQAGIYVYHMLGRDKFGSQFSLVEKSRVPYVIIMGKKEFLENSAMVRDNATRIQETVPLEKLADYIAKLKK
jgi:histidyl-tRNA synthetase